jgi:hypothetical protein
LPEPALKLLRQLAAGKRLGPEERDPLLGAAQKLADQLGWTVLRRLPVVGGADRASG